MKQTAIYRKGKIGRSTTTQNLTAALSTVDNKILFVGRDPQADSTRMPLSDLNLKTVPDTLRNEGGEGVYLETVLHLGFGGIKCVESGGPEPSAGYEGRGIITSTGLFENDQSNDLVKNFVFTILYRNPETYYLA
ncbi:MAG TPA: AAA family ATPase [Methanosarcina sp.]|jgi:nitrogenase iron protein NifH|nr:AAA family ATPase [Methanosarcina sp.]